MTTPPPRRDPKWALLTLVPLLVCCNADYRAVATFASDGLRDDTAYVEVWLVDRCNEERVRAGAAPTESSWSARLTPTGGAAAPIDAPDGRHSLWARAVGPDCAVVAAGCVPVALEPVSGGDLEVRLTRVREASICSTGATCDGAGECSGLPDGGTDAGTDAGTTPVDAGTDAGTDAGPTPVDAGTTPVDAGTDAGPTPVDAGTDAGPTPVDAGSDAGSDAGTDAG